MRTPRILLIPAVTLLVGCAGTMSDPLPLARRSCREVQGPRRALPTEGFQAPKLVDKGKGGARARSSVPAGTPASGRP